MPKPPYKKLAFAVAISLMMSTSAVFAAEQHHAPTAPVSNVIDFYAPAMAAMHQNMAIPPTGDADVDFVRGMIPHHQGAVDMAKIQLEHGKDPKIRKMAQEVIAAQEREIAFMKDWLKDRGY